EIVRITESLFVDVRSDHVDAAAFRDAINPKYLVKFGEIMDAARLALPEIIRANTKKDRNFDGAFIGKSGNCYSSQQLLSKIPRVAPANAVGDPGLIVMVNGLNTTAAEQHGHLQKVAEAFERPIVGIHSAKLSSTLAEFSRAREDVSNMRNN